MKWVYVIVVLLCLSACGMQNREQWVNADEHNIVSKGGVYLLDSEPYNGYLYKMFSNGDTSSILHCKNGKPDGVTRKWMRKGQLKSIAHYKDGIYHGNVKEYFNDGELFKDFNYVNGQEQGMQTMYWKGGEVRAHYEVKNGRKYGLTGIKNCSTPFSDSLMQLLTGASVQN